MSEGGAGDAPSQQELLSRAALTVFRLNGQFLSVADELARPGGLTAAWWQVLGAVLPGPLPVAGIARTMGITRQSVQRIADLLVERGLAEYAENPAHRRAKLLRVTGAGRDAVSRIDPPHAEFAARLAGEVGMEDLASTVTALDRLSEALETLSAADNPPLQATDRATPSTSAPLATDRDASSPSAPLATDRDASSPSAPLAADRGASSPSGD
ncbi:MarR family winged helix-turn-helix transcriptional regulator [Streptomyces sp. PTY087I2]|uniref:MarR family winged helix-turn-helix transcriptional regulator n=1 Tax=Streptomyces sp. PTY087I2 TaxID=1819298 RepID=UPI0008285C04|nr:helix-turn-helix domain-containing protein [Streptomyces sp. PTY087I2]OCC09179.1 MarR family protein [Streptomyces sp. PTY087I2]